VGQLPDQDERRPGIVASASAIIAAGGKVSVARSRLAAASRFDNVETEEQHRVAGGTEIKNGRYTEVDRDKYCQRGTEHAEDAI
jgi:hypothetical protein